MFEGDIRHDALLRYYFTILLIIIRTTSMSVSHTSALCICVSYIAAHQEEHNRNAANAETNLLSQNCSVVLLRCLEHDGYYLFEYIFIENSSATLVFYRKAFLMQHSVNMFD